MAATNQGSVIGSRTSIAFTGSGLTALADGTYVTSTAAVDLHNLVASTYAPLDVILTFEATPGTVASNKQALLFIQTSMDGSNFSTGPTSGTTTTDQPNLEPIMVLPLNTNSTQQRRERSILAAIGFIPYAFKPVVFNNSGAAFSAAAVFYTIVYGASV
jgi:hypothetical protein